MTTKRYQSYENAKKGFDKIVREWASWLKMDEKMWIVKYTSINTYFLQDYAPMTDKHPSCKIFDTNKRFILING